MDPRKTVALLVLGLGACLAQEETTPEQEQGGTTVPSSEDLKISYKGAQVWTIGNKYEKELVELDETGEITRWGKNESYSEYFIAPDKLATVKSALKEKGIPFLPTIQDVQEVIDSGNPVLSEDYLAELTGRNGHRMTFVAYHRLSDIMGYLDYLAQTFPQIVSVGTLGNSVEGRPIKYVKISSGAPNPKKFWIDGGTHAREWISPAAVAYIINELVENRDAYAADINGIDFYILPVVNPDGYEYSHSVDRLWRKNRSKSSYFCAGTDLNRNWGYRWGGKGTSKQHCKEIFAGSGPFSEPETRAVSNFVLSNLPNADAFVTFHSYGQFILYPYGYDNHRPAPDKDDLDRVGRKIQQAIRQATGSFYTVGNSADTLYPASGGADDWAKGSANIKYTYTIELRDNGRYGFLLPASYIVPTAKEAFAAIRTIASEIKV